MSIHFKLKNREEEKTEKTTVYVSFEQLLCKAINELF